MNSAFKVLLSLVFLIVTTGSAMAMKVDNTPRIALISAFQPEITLFLKNVKKQKRYVINGKTFTIGKLKGKNVVLFLSGISMINATMSTQVALDYFNVERIVFSGIAGGVNPDLHIGDVTIPKRWANYQEQSFANRKGKEWILTPWQTKELGNFGMMFPQYTGVTVRGNKPDKEEHKFWFDVDPVMYKTAVAVSKSSMLIQCTEAKVCLGRQPKIKPGGLGVSGSTFVNNREYREWVWKNFKDSEGNRVNALDMESSAVATVAYTNKVPFIAFRSLSDLAGGGDEAENELDAFFQLAANNASKTVMNFLEKLK